MTDFWLTFTIDGAAYNNRTRAQRYDALIDELAAISEAWWEEPTSFIMFRTSRNIDQVAQVCKRAIAPPHDIVLVREVNTKSARVLGKCDDFQTLKLFMEYVKRA